MRQLGMSRGTFYKYKRMMLLQSADILRERSAKLLYEELNITQLRLEKKLRELQNIIQGAETKPKEKIEAMRLQRDIILDIARLQVELPDVIKDHKLKLKRDDVTLVVSTDDISQQVNDDSNGVTERSTDINEQKEPATV